MNVLDLFSGIGGISLGLERAGMRTIAFSEIEPYCCAVLAKHWPHVPNLGDIRAVGAEQIASLEPIDVICGGFPCQDISVAGKGAGLAGERSGLWTEYARLIRLVRPTYVLVENVSALLSRGLSTVLGDLAAVGYDGQWHCVPASHVGAPHRRDRVWIIAHTQRDELWLESGRSCGTHGTDSPKPRDDGTQGTLADTMFGRLSAVGKKQVGAQDADVRSTALANTPWLQPGWSHQWTIGERARPGSESGCDITSWWESEPDVGRVAHGVPARVDRLRSLGNAVVPQIPEIIGRAIMKAHATNK